MITIKPMLRKLDLITQRVLDVKRKTQDYIFWSLFLDDSRGKPREIDTCATSLCVSLLVKAPNTKKEAEEAIKGGIKTLIHIRNDDGSWPSVVKPKDINSIKNTNSGIVAIGDTCFALNALIDAGFLQSEYMYCTSADAFSKQECRWDYVLKSCEWLIDNRAINNNEGWYYTNSRKETESVATVLATSNVAILFNRILNESRLCPNTYINNKRQIIDKIRKVCDSAVDMLLLNVNRDGGIGKTIIRTSDCPSSYLHTAKLIDVLVSKGRLEDKDDLKNAINYILNNYDTELKNRYDSLSNSFYVENYCLVTEAEEEISISHENYIEGILIPMLLDVYKKSGYPENICNEVADEDILEKIRLVINDLINQLCKMQEFDNKSFNGLFRCRVERPEGKFPVYSSFYAFQSALMYEKTFFPKKAKCDSKRLDALNVKAAALNRKLNDFVSDHGLDKDNKDVLLKAQEYIKRIKGYLEEIQQPCMDDRCAEIECSLDEMQMFYKNDIGEEYE